VKHFSIENVPKEADLVVIQERLVERANQKVTQPIISIKNYIGDPKLDELINKIKEALS
jgi:Phosphotransferase system, mannitol-specific IIBC component